MLSDEDLEAIALRAKAATWSRGDMTAQALTAQDVPGLLEELKALRGLLATTELSLKIVRESHDLNVKALADLAARAERWKKALASVRDDGCEACLVNYAWGPGECPACRAKEALKP